MYSNKIPLLIALLVQGLFPPHGHTEYAYGSGITNKADPNSFFGKYCLYYLNQPPVYYAEDFYELYARRSCYGEEEINLNIVFMQGALKSPYRPAYRSLVPIHSEREHEKYRNLLKMHMNVRIMQDYLTLGRLYDMQKLYFYHEESKEDLIKSLKRAEYYYLVAKDYWTDVKTFAVEAYVMNDIRIPLENLEDEMRLIVQRDVDWQYDRILNIHLEKVRSNLEKLEAGNIPSP
jgi:hypothetical protein